MTENCRDMAVYEILPSWSFSKPFRLLVSSLSWLSPKLNTRGFIIRKNRGGMRANINIIGLLKGSTGAELLIVRDWYDLLGLVWWSPCICIFTNGYRLILPVLLQANSSDNVSYYRRKRNHAMLGHIPIFISLPSRRFMLPSIYVT